MIRDEETLNILLDSIARFVREVLVPNEALVADTDCLWPEPDPSFVRMTKMRRLRVGPPWQGIGVGASR